MGGVHGLVRGVMTPVLPSSRSPAPSARVRGPRLLWPAGGESQRAKFGTRLVCRAETRSIWPAHEAVGGRRGAASSTSRGWAGRRDRAEGEGDEKGGDRNNVFIKKGPSKSSSIVLFAGYARPPRDNYFPAGLHPYRPRPPHLRGDVETDQRARVRGKFAASVRFERVITRLAAASADRPTYLLSLADWFI